MNELTTQDKNIEVSKEKIVEYLTAFNITNLTPQEQSQFIEIAIAYQLNPFKREIYCVPYMKSIKNEQTDKWEKTRALSIITGYEVYLKRAERTGKMNGWKCEIAGDTQSAFRAIATIYRKDWQFPFVHEVYFNEVAQKDAKGELRNLWAKMPKFMLKKVCIAQAFRLCFPDEFGGMPYIADELPENMTNIQYIEPENTKKAEEKPDELTTKLMALPEDIQQGFKALGYTSKSAVVQFCENNAWDNDVIRDRLKKVADGE